MAHKAKKILVVEDDEQILHSLAFVLEFAGYYVDKAKNGMEAMEKLLGNPDDLCPFDLLVTDIFMPKMNGLELIDEIKRRGVDMPIIVITGYGQKSTAEKLLLRGHSDFISKPFEPKKLLERILSIFERKETVNNV